MSDFEERMRQLDESIEELEAQKQELYNSKYEECIERIKPYVGKCFIQLPRRHRAIYVLTMPNRSKCKEMGGRAKRSFIHSSLLTIRSLHEMSKL